MKTSYYLLLFVFTNFSCNSEYRIETPYNIIELWATHHQYNWDSLSTANHLIGEWEWFHSACCPEGTLGASFTEEKNMVIHYNPDGTLEVFENNNLTQQSDWFVKLEDADLYGIIVTPPVTQLYGRILFGENSALFNDSYRDGVDNYFIKIN